MQLSDIIVLFGGLGSFLFGMKYMGDGLEMAAGSRMKDLLEKFLPYVEHDYIEVDLPWE